MRDYHSAAQYKHGIMTTNHGPRDPKYLRKKTEQRCVPRLIAINVNRNNRSYCTNELQEKVHYKKIAHKS